MRISDWSSDVCSSDLQAVEAVRAVPRPLDLQPATRFDPRMPGRIYPPQNNGVRLASGSVPSLPKADADIAYASATQQAHWVRTRQITSARLTDIYQIGRASCGESVCQYG